MNSNGTQGATPAGVGLVHKTIQILDLFQLDAANWSQAEIVQATGMPKSTVNRLVRFLAEKKYLVAVDGRNRYSLGPAAIDLGRRASALFDFGVICHPMLERLARQTNETVLLTALVASGQAVRCVDQIESTREGLRVFEQIGGIFPLHAGAAPKAILAFLPEVERERYVSRPLNPVTSRTLVDPVLLRRDLEEIRKRGYAISREETYEGVAGISAAFFWQNERPAGSIAIALPLHRATPEKIAWFGELLVEAAAKVSMMLAIDEAEPQLEEAS